MTDPAVEAAKRAERASGWWKELGAHPWDADYATDSANEALKPIREMHRVMSSDRPGVQPGGAFAEGMDFVLGELAELIFAKEERP